MYPLPPYDIYICFTLRMKMVCLAVRFSFTLVTIQQRLWVTVFNVGRVHKSTFAFIPSLYHLTCPSALNVVVHRQHKGHHQFKVNELCLPSVPATRYRVLCITSDVHCGYSVTNLQYILFGNYSRGYHFPEYLNITVHSLSFSYITY